MLYLLKQGNSLHNTSAEVEKPKQITQQTKNPTKQTQENQQKTLSRFHLFINKAIWHPCLQ